ncbi:hypothetical protein [Leptospira noguchii]|uniref:Uncharacterized protein n=1 Tax=Leptospira noguchii TaxID=28182 RepID=M6VWF3_9LEPT|nr:hypothetical protein [Leptospira noguchii]EMO53883.1 hypothetical protein LEP1GSC172_3273 [Leptospira noguchii]
MNDEIYIKEDITEFAREVIYNMGPKIKKFEIDEKSVYLDQRIGYWHFEQGLSLEDSKVKAIQDYKFSFEE